MVDGNHRRAFLLGCNGPNLAYCEADAERMRDVLARHGWDVDLLLSRDIIARCPASGDVNDPVPRAFLDQRLRRFARTIECGDDVLVYVSCHGLYRCELKLLIGRDAGNPEDCDHWIAISDLVKLLGLENKQKKPGQALLILDCCDGGAAAKADFWRKQSLELEMRLWVASALNKSAHELRELQGGLFTHWIVRGLGEDAHRLPRDRGNRNHIRFNDLKRYVRDKIEPLAEAGGHRFSIPQAHGPDHHDPVLAKCCPLDLATGFSGHFRGLLETQIMAADFEPDALRRIFAQVRSAARLTATQGYAEHDHPGDLETPRRMIDFLAEAGWREDCAVVFPLGEFVWRLSQATGEPHAKMLSAALRAGLQPFADGDTDALIEELRLGASAGVEDTPVEHPTHLCIALCRGNYSTTPSYEIEIRLVDACGNGKSVWARPGLRRLDEVGDVLDDAFGERAVSEAVEACAPLALEFFLPLDLLGADVDRWTPGRWHAEHPNNVKPLSHKYLVSVRSLDRLPSCGTQVPGRAKTEYLSGWSIRWNRHCHSCWNSTRDGTTVPDECAWFDADEAQDFEFGDHARDVCLFLLGFTPDRDQLDEMLSAGVGAVLWADGDQALQQDFPLRLIQQVADTEGFGSKRPRLEDLPRALHELRVEHWQDTKGQSTGRHTGHYHLFWDDPNRKPEFGGRAAATSETSATATRPLRLASPY